jgi:8-oxo-dGTP pyrophosphatase MutT (NUDIX family)
VLQSEFVHTKTRLREALASKLPGEKAHRLMLPQGRELLPKTDISTIVQSSVMMLLFPHKGKINTCLIKRPSAMRHHAGQVAFPGGRHEPEDKDLLYTALRESYEEIGTEFNQIEILGALTPLYVQVSNFMINPFIGWSDLFPHFEIDKHEVDEIFIIPLEQLLHHSANQYRKVNAIHGVLDVPGFYIDNLFIWGATAMIISEFNELFLSITDK